ncbi:hypothetical protein [Alicyclobacillus acidoterrestris]|uniref:Uncharacterized protein n=1 Tax=Alicyclobacillus acidoterrestris (strain ATCC 49025 / DSM 3922 / CIP 106132 / NCIMB 13137 / GD3B) TaxID=1356854 RepID=T0C3R8_ALIAG|nr:hypothetical protein [Alicyclobacillus acidoterrestris]EPZ47639.1 hypothetical protein N007_05115 [Alicyclobacillus acidoterrestris ATCC 49025]UNO48041.1 hypothetical protein K1I37_15315 [Alicyclobacillus acidoterrestris]
MKLPALFRLDADATNVSRTKVYEVKAKHFLVDLAEDAEVFVKQGFALVSEGEAAIKQFTGLDSTSTQSAVETAKKTTTTRRTK